MKALSVFSGGLDSLLASELIRAQGVDVLALFFETPFFRARNAERYAARMGLPLRIVDITGPHLTMVQNPVHGYGENMNPCIDCHTLMIRTAGDLLREEGARFIITGEVLGQRPMSQNRKALSTVEAESGYAGLVLRPLSAKRLPPTIPEQEGWVDREGLKGLSGRSRKPQMALARELGIGEYPSPAGGCLLTDRVFSIRLRDLLKVHPDPIVRDLEILKVGRHFRIGTATKVVVGRNQKENLAIQSMARSEDRLLTCVRIPGPSALMTGEVFSKDEIETALRIVAAYSDAQEGQDMEIQVEGDGERLVLAVPATDKARYRPLMI